MTKVAVILSGVGVFDGSEVYEAVITLLRLDQQGAEVQCLAPDVPQMHVINHITGDEMEESRNVLTEAARLCRGEIRNLANADADDFDALIIPGGFGAAKNLSDFAVKGSEACVQKDVLRFCHAMFNAKKPVFRLPYVPLNEQQRAQGIDLLNALSEKDLVGQSAMNLNDDDFIILV